MADQKKADKADEQTPTNYQGNPANQETGIREASVPDEKPHETTVAQLEEIKS